MAPHLSQSRSEPSDLRPQVDDNVFLLADDLSSLLKHFLEPLDVLLSMPLVLILPLPVRLLLLGVSQCPSLSILINNYNLILGFWVWVFGAKTCEEVFYMSCQPRKVDRSCSIY